MAQHRLTRDQVIWSFGPDLQPVLEIDPQAQVGRQGQSRHHLRRGHPIPLR